MLHTLHFRHGFGLARSAFTYHRLTEIERFNRTFALPDATK
jgi:hypothetical protein